MSDFGVVIVGLRHGHSRGYVDTINHTPGARVAALVEPDGQVLRKTADALGLPGHTDLTEALARPDVDIALILLPHRDCPAAAVEAAKAGKHVIVEKPCAATAAAWRDALVQIEGAGVRCAVPFVWRYHPLVRETMRAIKAGEIGPTTYCSGNIIGGPPSRYTTGVSPWMVDKRVSGGGALHNLGVHFIDLFNWVIGQRPCCVTAQVSSAMHGLEVEDYARILMWYPGGECASVEAGYSLPLAYPPDGYENRACVKGRGGVVEWHTRGDEMLVASDLPQMRHAPVRRQQVSYPRLPGYFGLPTIVFLEETLAALRKEEEPPITGQDALAALEVVEAAYRSAEEGAVVQLAPR